MFKKKKKRFIIYDKVAMSVTMNRKRPDSFIVLWSDYTWEKFILKYDRIEVKERFDLSKAACGNMPRRKYYKIEVKDGFDPLEAVRGCMTRRKFLKYYMENIEIIELES